MSMIRQVGVVLVGQAVLGILSDWFALSVIRSDRERERRALWILLWLEVAAIIAGAVLIAVG